MIVPASECWGDANHCKFRKQESVRGLCLRGWPRYRRAEYLSTPARGDPVLLKFECRLLVTHTAMRDQSPALSEYHVPLPAGEVRVREKRRWNSSKETRNGGDDRNDEDDAKGLTALRLH